MSQIAEETILVAAASSVSADLEGEAVILDTDAGEYYGLNEVGARIWSLLQEPMTFDELVNTLLGEYAVERDQCEREAERLLGQMAEKNLIEIRQADPAADDFDPAAASRE